MKKLITATLLATAAMTAAPTMASPTTITLDTSSLPSTQGWSYIADGDGASVPEASADSIVGGVLHQNTLGIGMTTGGGNLYHRAVTLGATESWTLTMVARVNAFESVLNPAYPFALFLGGGANVAVGFGSDNVQALTDLGIVSFALPGGFDSSAYNSYRLSTTGGGLQSFSINGTSIFSNLGYSGGNPATISFGDGTGFANADADIRSLVFTSSGVPEPASWALMIAGFGAVGAAARRQNKVRVTFA